MNWEEEEAGGWRKEIRWLEEAGDSEEKEIKDVMRKMKNKKAAGIDGIPMEVWKNAGKDLWRSLVMLLKQIWKNGIIPED